MACVQYTMYSIFVSYEIIIMRSYSRIDVLNNDEGWALTSFKTKLHDALRNFFFLTMLISYGGI